MAHSISDEVATVLRSATCLGSSLILNGQLDRKMYTAVNKVLELSGFEWNRKQKCHVAKKDTAAETLAKALGDQKIIDPKKEFDFFQTPENIAGEMVRLADIQMDDIVLEPSAGGGRIVRAILKTGIDPAQVVAVEIQDDLRLALVPHCTVIHAVKDFLEYELMPESNGFDKIIANPPFSCAQDVLHCRHMYDLLKSGGRMVCITGPGWQYNSTTKFVEFRNWFESLRGTTVTELPSGTFKDSGTNVWALLLTIDKE